MKHKAAIFDRDGTLIRDTGYLHDPGEVVLLNGASECLKELKQEGYYICLASNQSGIGRGYFSMEDCLEVNQRVEQLLGMEFDAVEICPHAPEDNCICRKPSPYMLNVILKRLECSGEGSFYAGDKKTDVEAAHNCGITGFRMDLENKIDQGSSTADAVITDFSQIMHYLFGN